MAVAIIQSWDEPGDGKAYDALSKEMNVADEPPQGAIFHWVGNVNGKWTITDVWESRADYDRFMEERLMPALQRIGDQIDATPPEVTEAEVYNHAGS